MIDTASQILSKNSMITIPTATQNMANPQILFIIHFDSIRFLATSYAFPSVYVAAFRLVHKKSCRRHFCFCARQLQSYALSTFPDFKQEVQTYNFFVAPFTLHLTDLMFGLNILLDLLCEWLTLLPKRTLFPQTEHLAIRTPPCVIECFKIENLTSFSDLQHDYSIRSVTQMQGEIPEKFIFFENAKILFSFWQKAVIS